MKDLLKKHWKTISVGIGGTYLWGNMVVASEPAKPTAAEWMVLVGYWLAACGITVARNQEP